MRKEKCEFPMAKKPKRDTTIPGIGKKSIPGKE